MTRHTSAPIAMANLAGSIRLLERVVSARSTPAANHGSLTDLLLLRGEITACIADYDRAEAVAARSIAAMPDDPASSLAMARVLSRFHRFQVALDWLAKAEGLAADPTVVATERAGILQATGHLDEALPIRERAVQRSPNLSNCVAFAVLLAERGEDLRVRELFTQAIAADRDVSPFALIHALFQRSHVAMRRGELEAAADDLERILVLLPEHVPAKGHLAEVRLAQGLPERALALAVDLPRRSEDPEYLALRAEALIACGRQIEADDDVAAAERGYARVLRSRSEAYADHAAHFYLHLGGDPCRAVEWASLNASFRNTARARMLLQRAEAACLQWRRRAVLDRDAPPVPD